MADKLDLTKPVQTRDGRPVRILCLDFASPLSIVYAIKNNDGSEQLHSCYPNGIKQPHVESWCDLINAPPKPVKYYAHVYRRPNGCVWIGNCGADDGKRVPPSCDGRSEFVKTIEFEVQP